MLTGLQPISLHGPAHQLKDEQNYVIAAVRDRSARGLQDLLSKQPSGHLEIVHLDLADVASIRNAATNARDILHGSLDYLIHCAGVSMQDLTPFEDL